MKKIAISLIAGCFSVFMASAKEVGPEIAKKAATNYFQSNFASAERSSTNLELKETVYLKDGKPCMYLFANSNGGYVLMSADDQVYPVLSCSGDDELNLKTPIPAVKALLNGYKAEVVAAKSLKSRASNLENQNAWTRLLSNARSGEVRATVGPLIKTRWAQSPYYNSMCPRETDTSERALTGCVATAMGQIIKYWEFPARGGNSDVSGYAYSHVPGFIEGRHNGFRYNYGIVSANFAEVEYDYSKMPNRLYDENDDVARLLFHCGVSVKMKYGPDGSGSLDSNAAAALPTYFSYSHDINVLEKKRHSLNDWDTILRNNLEMGWPVLYTAGDSNGSAAHAFIIDGYRDNLYSINWGWGTQTNYYKLTEMMPYDIDPHHELKPVDTLFYVDSLKYDPIKHDSVKVDSFIVKIDTLIIDTVYGKDPITNKSFKYVLDQRATVNIYPNTYDPTKAKDRQATAILTQEDLVAEIFPNPASNMIYVNHNLPNGEKAYVSLYTIEGVLVKNEFIDTAERTHLLNTSDVTSGMYLIEIRANNKVSRNKIMINH